MHKIKKIFIPSISIFLLLICANLINAEISNATVTSLTPQSFSDIYFGISTGGYKIMAEKGEDYIFRIFVKNGMPDRSLHNLRITPKEDFIFSVNDITPNSIEQLKPMEIKIYYVNISIPENTVESEYNISFDVESDEFPRGIFSLGGEKEKIKIVRKINTPLYVTMFLITTAILGIFFYRKYKQRNN